MYKKNTVNDAMNLAIGRAGQCLSSVYKNNKSRLKWKCVEGHVWLATYDGVLSGKWCKQCHNNKRKNNTIEYLKNIAIENGGQCLSNEYKGSNTKLLFSCKKGHIWETLPGIIKRGHWCQECWNISIDDCIDIAKRKGGKCLSKVCNGNKDTIIWKCSAGHKWETDYNHICCGTWCPICNKKPNKAQNKVMNILQNIFGIKALYNFRPDWMKDKDTHRNQEIDIYFPDIKLAVEYHGEQHFTPVRFGGISEADASSRLIKTKNADLRKIEKIKNNSEKVKFFVVFDYTEKLTKKYIIKKLLACGVSIGTKYYPCFDDVLDTATNPSPKIDFIDYGMLR